MQGLRKSHFLSSRDHVEEQGTQEQDSWFVIEGAVGQSSIARSFDVVEKSYVDQREFLVDPWSEGSFEIDRETLTDVSWWQTET